MHRWEITIRQDDVVLQVDEVWEDQVLDILDHLELHRRQGLNLTATVRPAAFAGFFAGPPTWGEGSE